jgi:hypothetical protein
MEIESVNMGQLPNGKVGINIRLKKDGNSFAKILTTADDYADASAIVEQAKIEPTIINGYKELNNG